MKNNIKYLFLIFLIMFICNLNVSASDITDYCYYNFTGLAPSGGGAAQDAIFEVDIYDEGVSARGKGLGDFADIMHEDLVINWGEEKNSFDSKKYYDSMGKSCPPYAIFYIIKVQSGDDSDNIFLSDYDHIAGDQNEAFFTGNRHTEFIMKLIDTNKDTTVKETCNYRDFDISYNDDNEVIKIETKNEKIFNSSIEMSFSSSTVDLCQPIKSCENKILFSNLSESRFSDKHRFLFYSDTTTWSVVGDCVTLEPLSNKSTTTTCIRYSLFMNGNENENIDGLKDYWTRYKECLDNNNAACAVEEISNYNNKKDILKSWCNTILSNNDYDNSCVQRCLDLNTELLYLEGTTDPNNTGDTCGLSKRLVSWILNIVKWAKYIIPAILVILGIIDFIRAIASDKDDEMKKAQGRFIKRLIAAALIFIVPFILEFVLDKMGFEVSSCGIIRELD